MTSVRPCEPDEVGRFLAVCFAAFGGALDDDEAARVAPVFEHERLLFGLVDREVAGTAGALRFALSVPGGEVPCAGVTMVGVLPDHRRRGVFRRLMTRLLEDAHERGEPLSVLWSTSGSLYRRFGYGLASDAARVEVRSTDAVLWRSREPSPHRVRLVPVGDALASARPVHDAVRSAVPGMPSRSDAWWRIWRLEGPPGTARGAPPLACAVVEDGGQPVAYALYRVHGSWDAGVSTARLEVVEALGATPRGTEEIWRYLLGLDLVERVRALHLPVDHPLPLLVHEPARLRVTLTDGLWLRVVDARAALEERAYATDGEAVIELSDSECPWNDGRWLLSASPSGATLERTRRRADLRLGAAELGAACLGGTSFSRLARAGLVDELRASAARRLDTLFGWAHAPWCPQEF